MPSEPGVVGPFDSDLVGRGEGLRRLRLQDDDAVTVHPAEVVTPQGWIVNRSAEGTALTLFQENVQRTTWTADKAARNSSSERICSQDPAWHWTCSPLLT